MVQYLISQEKVTYYLKFLIDSDSRTIIVGLQQLLFTIEGGAVLLPNDCERIVNELLRIIQSNNDPRVRQWCYMLGAFIISKRLADLCLRKMETEVPKNQSWMLALLSNNMEEKQFLRVRKQAEHYLSKDVINLSTYLFSTNQFDVMNTEYVSRIINKDDDELALLWLGWIATFHNQNRRSRGRLLVDSSQMDQLTGFSEDNVLKHIMAAYSRRQVFIVGNLQFDVFDYTNMESEHKKWTLTAIWKDEKFVEQNKDYFIELMSKRHLFQLCDKRVREGLASGLATYKYDADFVYYVLDWYSNEPEDSVKHFLLLYMLKWQKESDDYFELINALLYTGTEKEKLLIKSKIEKRVIKPMQLSYDEDNLRPMIRKIKEQNMLSKITLQRYISQCDKIIASNDVKAAEELQKEILAVFSSDLDGLKRGLTNYSFLGAVSQGSITTYVQDEVDYIKDLKLLRCRLQVELEKEGVTMSNNSINIYGDVTGTQIQQGSSNSSQTQTPITGTDVEQFQSILDQINKYRSQFPEEFGEKSEELIAALDQAQQALNTKNQSLWKKAIGVVIDLAKGAGGSLIASGILGLLPPV